MGPSDPEDGRASGQGRRLRVRRLLPETQECHLRLRSSRHLRWMRGEVEPLPDVPCEDLHEASCSSVYLILFLFVPTPTFFVSSNRICLLRIVPLLNSCVVPWIPVLRFERPIFSSYAVTSSRSFSSTIVAWLLQLTSAFEWTSQIGNLWITDCWGAVLIGLWLVADR